MIYEEFFQQHEYIFSLPFSTNRSGDVAGNFIGIPMRQKIPLRMYIWVSIWNKESWIGNLYQFENTTQQFFSEKITEYHNSIEAYFFSIINHYGIKNIKVDILSECSKSVWLGFTSLISLWLCSALHYVVWKLSASTIQSIENISIMESLKNNEIQDLIESIVYFESLCNIEARLAPKLTSFFPWSWPILSFRESSTNLCSHSSNQIYWFRLHELSKKICKKKLNPFDFHLFYSGKPFAQEKINDSHVKNTKFNKIRKNIMHLFELCNNIPIDDQPKFYKYLLQVNDNEIKSLFGKITWSISIEIIYNYIELLKEHSSESDYIEFSKAIEKFKHSYYLTRDSNCNFIALIENIQTNINKIEKSSIIFPIDSIHSWGCIWAISYLEHNRKEIESYSDEHPTISLLYSNYKDGYEKQWFIVEQDINKAIESEFSLQSNYKLLNRDNSMQLMTYNNTVSESSNDIILDLVKKRIHILGHQCTSEELFSQYTTIELLSTYIQNNKQTINNKLLSPSTYTKNKNELISKVIKPFVKLVKEKLWRNIAIDCIWSNSYYDIEFDLNNLKCGILTRKVDKITLNS